MSTNEPMTQEQLDAIQERAGEVTTLRSADFNDWQELALDLSECVDDLLAEVERLQHFESIVSWRYGDTMDGRTREDMVERGARAFYEHPTPGVDASLRTSWDRLATICPEVADNHRAHMRAVLDAALNPREGS